MKEWAEVLQEIEAQILILLGQEVNVGEEQVAVNAEVDQLVHNVEEVLKEVNAEEDLITHKEAHNVEAALQIKNHQIPLLTALQVLLEVQKNAELVMEAQQPQKKN